MLSNIYNIIPTNISKLTGVDLDEKGDLELDTNDFIIQHNNTIDENPKLTGELIEFHKKDGVTFLNELKTEQDLIIFSNFLHLFTQDKAMEAIKMALNKLTPNGIIFLKARSKKKPFNSDEERYPFDNGTIEEIKSFSTVLAFEEVDIHYNLILKT